MGPADNAAEDAEEDKADAGVIADAEEVRSADSTPDAGFVPVRDFVPVTGFVPATDFDVFGRGFFRTDQPKWPSASPSAKYSPWE